MSAVLGLGSRKVNHLVQAFFHFLRVVLLGSVIRYGKLTRVMTFLISKIDDFQV